MEAFAGRDVELNVVSPRPYAPPIGPYSAYRDLPRIESYAGYTVHRPRFFYGLPQRVFYGVSGRSFANRVPSYVERTFAVPDVVHACQLYMDGYGLIPYCRTHDVPLFAVAHGAALNGYDSFGRGVRTKIRKTLAAADRVLCVSRALEERALEIEPEAETTLFPIGANPERFPVGRSDAIRRERGIPHDETVVLFCGQFVERKGVAEIIEVLPTLDLSHTRFVFVGQPGEMHDPLERAVSEAGVADRVEIHLNLPTETLREYFAIADLLLLPSFSEGRPTVIYEAMAAETAILGASVGGIPEQVVDGETGSLIRPGEPEVLRRELERLVGDRDELRRLGANGHWRLLDQGWTWDAHAERMERIHRDVIEAQ